MLWIRRINVFAALCRAGVDFIHSDVDAVWMRDPRAAYFDERGVDLIISQGTVWPPDVHRQFGFVLCCGLFQLRSNAGTQRLLGELAEDVLSTRDDQVSLNRLIAARSIAWQIDPDDAYHVEGAGKQFLCSRSVIRGVGSDGLRLSVLPHHLFQRVPAASEEAPYLLHLLTRQDPAAKLLEFEIFRCLLLRPDWQPIDFDSGSLTRLMNAGARRSGLPHG